MKYAIWQMAAKLVAPENRYGGYANSIGVAAASFQADLQTETQSLSHSSAQRKPSQFISFGGWFERGDINWGKRFRAAGSKMPQKLRLRNLRSMNVFLDADFWAAKLPNLISAASDAKKVFVSGAETV